MTMEEDGGRRDGRTAFHALTPDTVIGVVEKALGVRCTNRFYQLNSYINRVYELEREDGGGLVAKFYRPGRWSREALLDEHEFMGKLVEAEVPVIAPLPLHERRDARVPRGNSLRRLPQEERPRPGRVHRRPVAGAWTAPGARPRGRGHAPAA